MIDVHCSISFLNLETFVTPMIPYV